MSALETIARAEHWLRPALHALPASVAIRLFSAGRNAFAARYAHQVLSEQRFSAPSQHHVRAWGMEFSMPIWNAAGMFKKGEGYATVARQGAGAYVAGTTTSEPRLGNVAKGVRWPTASYPRSGVASNWMGLPNEGHATVAARLAVMPRIAGCPVGASVSADPGVHEERALSALVDGMLLYQAAGVDYLELNESCPNVPGHASGDNARADALDQGLLRRLQYVAEYFLQRRPRALPVVVKFSTDTELDQVDALVRTLVDLGFDGIILGNTSTRYQDVRPQIVPQERAVFDQFTTAYGGGLSGRVLRDASLALCAQARRAADVYSPHHEFQVIRCGGVSSAADIAASAAVGVHLNQWYVGYFDAFALHGHDLYRALSSQLDAL